MEFEKVLEIYPGKKIGGLLNVVGFELWRGYTRVVGFISNDPQGRFNEYLEVETSPAQEIYVDGDGNSFLITKYSIYYLFPGYEEALKDTDIIETRGESNGD